MLCMRIWVISCPTVGLDIQQKFNMYFSKAKRFETESPYHISCDPVGQRQQRSAVKPQPSVHAVAQRENTAPATDTGTTHQMILTYTK